MHSIRLLTLQTQQQVSQFLSNVQNWLQLFWSSHYLINILVIQFNIQETRESTSQYEYKTKDLYFHEQSCSFLSEAAKGLHILTLTVLVMHQFKEAGCTLAWLGYTLRSWVPDILIPYKIFPPR